MNKCRDLDFERKHEEDLQRLRGFRLLDDDFMSKVFEDIKCAEFLLQIILNRDDLKVKKSNSQYSVKIYRENLCGWIFLQWIGKTVYTILKFSEMIKVLVLSELGITAV